MATKPAKKTEVALFDATQKFSLKKLGANMILTYGPTERYARKVSMEEGETIKKKVERFNKKPNEKAKADIIKLMTPEAAKAKETKEKLKAAAKGIKQQVKKQVKKAKVDQTETKDFLTQLDEFLSSDETAVDKLQAILNKHKKVTAVVTPAPVVSARRLSGEH